ncbi:MAG TPA: MG2 domain-containing protein [Methylibium sp.]|nr:MG2 domain-containing protein [Methylibium sp.]
MRRLTAIVLVAACAAAQAARVESVSPRGEVAELRQVTVRFSAPVQPFGDLRAADPFALQCAGPVPAGQGRWADERTWLYDFKTALPPGVRCTLQAKADWQPREGMLEGERAFSFGTGGPAVLRVEPWEGSEVEEDQHFLLTLSGPATEASVVANAGCEVEGIGERLPVRVVGGAAREKLLKARRVTAARAAKLLLLTCARPLPNDVPMRLLWGKGIAAQANPAVLTTVAQRWSFRVRKLFTAEFSCERERAEAACLPIRPMRLRFSAPVDRALAAQALLRPASGAPLKPVFDADDKSPVVSGIAFPHPLAENASYSVELPAALRDDAGRTLANASLFPLKVATGEAPPIAKFASAPFGIVERGDAVVPITLRHVQGDLRPGAPAGRVRVKTLSSDADLLAWYAKLQAHHERQISAKAAGRPPGEWYAIEHDTDARGRPRERRVERWVGSRELSLLKADATARRLELPALQGGDPQPFEVVGLPLAGPGYHVLEVESQRLGAALLDAPRPMYVRTGVLVTKLGVHVKHGRENSLVWVTSLDRGQPVEGADVTVSDCNGQRLWAGRSDAQGLARIAQAIDAARPHCVADEGLFVTARKAEGGVSDVAFVFSSWQKGIEGWRFRHPTAQGPAPDLNAHTVFDRTLLRAGETVSMKHFIRAETTAGLAALSPAELPTTMKITHVGSGDAVSLPLQWPNGRHALSSWAIPPAARLGSYEVTLERGPRSIAGGSFRVEAFRVPLLEARLAGPKQVPVAPSSLPLTLQLGYQSGGGVAKAAVQVSALLKPRWPAFPEYEDYSFAPPREPADDAGPSDDEGIDEEQAPAAPDGRLVADKLPATTDVNGAATITLARLPPVTRPSELLAEARFDDPNGETQTVATRIPLWPSAVLLGLKTSSWVSNQGKVSFGVIVLDTAGKPIANQAVEVRGRVSQWLTTRTRMVGGFYAYDNRRESKDLGLLCSGRSDAKGRLACEAELQAAGQVELIATAADAQGRRSEAAATVWITRRGELWFAQGNDDRIDVLPEKKRYEPGETARLQVRSPFRSATALVAVEREGVIDTRLVTLRGDDPTVELKIDPAWAPNVYVSVLAVRGRVHQVPWYSLFTWGWRHPLAWWQDFLDGRREWRAPTAMVDLARPAHKFGVAALQVGRAAHELQVSVSTDRADYRVRGKALAKVKVTQDGRPLAGTEVAFAAVDEGLLALADNDSWQLLDAMLRQRPWGVETATAQGEIVGRRHYGRKAVAAGGGGGRGGTRELFDTLLLWRPAVRLDAKGEATIEVPLNDSLTSFRLVAVADQGVQRFGSGHARIRVTQDLQLLPGLPPLLRDGDRFRATVTLRNTTAKPMNLRATLAGSAARDGAGEGADALLPIATAPQSLTLAAGAAQELHWDIAVPPLARRIDWEAAVVEQGGAAPAQDRVKLSQTVIAAVPERVLQATIARLDGRHTLPVSRPADALPGQGGVLVALQPRLTGALPGLRRWWQTYPFVCLEQQAGKALALRDAALWQRVVNLLPTYLDADGLASYFPVREGDRPNGSDRLTAHLIAAADEAGFELPPALRERMLTALGDFVDGRIERRHWSPREDRDVRKLAALEALSRHGRAQARQLGTINLTPKLWPTAAVIDWLGVLQRVPGIAQQAERRAEAQQILRARLTWGGTTLRFSTEDSDYWWWLMDSADANAAKLLLAVLDEPGWRDELPRLAVGSLGRQRGGAWLTTTANLWGALALDKFAARFESQPVSGRSEATLAAARGAVDWAAQPEGGSLRLPWPAQPATLAVEQQGGGTPWLTVQSLAAVPLKAPLAAGYSVTRATSAVSQKTPGRWSRGDVMRVRLEIDAQSDMSWVVVSDPVPGGATLLGAGLGRDSLLATRDERNEGWAWPAWVERSPEAYRSYYDHLPRGKHVVEYTLRLGSPGRYALPPTRVEAMYAPESFGERPNEPVVVEP